MAEGNHDEKQTLHGNFTAYAKFGDHKSTGKTMTSKNFDKWLKESKVQDGKKVKSTDTDIAFTKVLGKKPKGTKVIEFSDLEQCLDEIAGHISKVEAKKKEAPEEEVKKEIIDEMKQKLTDCNHPGLKGTTHAQKSNVVDRLTDTSKYTGSHKERFSQTGKGKGIEGRMDRPEKAGYVSGYKNKETYDKKVGSPRTKSP
ncbi:PREDICTED: tubulin polymerization-promoting protein family member 3-like [Priapulus caudatus]|uniref:Tubulin polymerization-promoting protein family member 3-like n=1 Tax=Priapulus caudatus TaxID=37621 RepID=A0ABM1ER21_PRICU|nr:PREDICTED: tubulin polymerization-promoting protein family member 3-like [Priapulus caudatus]